MSIFRRKRNLVLGTIGIFCFALLRPALFGFDLSASLLQRWDENVEAVLLGMNAPTKQFVAVVSFVRSVESWKSVDDTSIYNAFLPSIWPSITDSERKAYRIELVLAFDEGDTFWESPAHRADISRGLPFAVNFISVENDRRDRIPFNEACRSAYEYGADYIVRVSDDTQFNLRGWITKGVDALASFSPPNVGVVGQTHREGNTTILTHDMVHRTHLEIFDDHRPDEFDNWYIGSWTSSVYGPKRTKVVHTWVVRHLIWSNETSYMNNREKTLLDELVDRGRKRIKLFLDGGVNEAIPRALFNRRIFVVEGPMIVVSSRIAKYQDDTNILQLVEAARLTRDRNPYGRYGVIIFLEKGLVTMTKHWICNVRRFGVVLSVVTFIATDMQAYRQLRDFDVDLNVVYFPAVRPGNALPFLHGRIAQYESMRFRTRLLSEILRNDIAFMIVESDAVWNSNVLQDISDLQIDWDSFDMLSSSDEAESNHLQGGIQLNQPTQRSKALWGAMHQKTVDLIREFHGSFGRDSAEYVGDQGSEQLIMEELVKSLGGQIGFKLKFLPRKISTSCEWYRNATLRTEIPTPSAILFNIIIGTPAKIAQAKANDHWFLDENNATCYDPDPQRRNTFRATIVVMTMTRFNSLERLLASLAAANYNALDPDNVNDIRLIIRIDRPTEESEDFDRVVAIARNFTPSVFSSVAVDVQETNKGLRAQWLTSFQDPRGWDEVGIFLEDDLEVSPHFFRYLRLQWMYHWNNPLLGAISLQRMTLRGTAPRKNDINSTIVNNHRPFLYRIVGSWGVSAKASTWIDFTSRYSNTTNVGIKGIIVTQMYKRFGASMWTMHFVHYLWKRNKFVHFVNLPNKLTMASNWQEPGVHFKGISGVDFSSAKEWIESSMGALDEKLATYGFDTLPEDTSKF